MWVNTKPNHCILDSLYVCHIPHQRPWVRKTEGLPTPIYLNFEAVGFWINIVEPEFNPVTCSDGDEEKQRKKVGMGQSERVGYGAEEMAERMRVTEGLGSAMLSFGFRDALVLYCNAWTQGLHDVHTTTCHLLL